MIVLRFSMQGEDILEHTNGKWYVLHFSIQEEEIVEHIHPKCHFLDILVNL